MKSLRRLFFSFTLLSCIATLSFAQRTNIKDYVSSEIVPDHADWNYKLGEQPNLQLRVMRNNVPLSDVSLSYEIGPEKMNPTKTGQSNMPKGTLSVKAGTMKSPGFMTCTAKATVDGIDYTNYINVAFEADRKSTRLNSSHIQISRMQSSA